MYSATRIRNVTGPARDDVNMGVFYGLPGGEAVVEADVETVRLEAREQALADLGD